MDLNGPSPKGKGNVCHIFVILNVFTKFTCLYPPQNATIANCLNKSERFFETYALLGSWESIISNNGRQYSPPNWVKFLTDKQMEARFTVLHHPQANPVETRMKIIGNCIRILRPSSHGHCAEFIQTTEERSNITTHCTTKIEPVTLFLKQFSLYGPLEDLSSEEYA